MESLAEYAVKQLDKHQYREGKREGKLEVYESATIKLLEMGVSIAQIAAILDCPVKTVEAIEKKWSEGGFSKNSPADN